MAKIRSLNGCLGATLSVILLNMSAWSEEVSVSRAARTFPNALPGKVVTIEKIFDTKTKRLYLRSDHESVQSAASLFGLEQAEANLVRQKNGALHEELVEKLKGIGDRDEVQVMVSLREPEGIVYLDKFEHSMEDLKAQSLAIANLKTSRSVGTILSRYAGVRKLVEEDFSAIAWASKGVLLRMAMDEEIGQISIYEPPQTTSKFFWNMGALFGQPPSSVNLNVLARSAYSHSQSAIPGGLATNIRAGTFESGLNTGFLSCLGITPVVWGAMPVPFTCLGSCPDAAARARDSNHSLVTFTNLVNAAPGAKFYHRRSWSYNNSGDINFIVNNELATLSMSTNVGEVVANALENRRVDDFAFRFPYPVFNNPTANGGWQIRPNWAAYNAISVGNVQDSANVHFKIDTITCGGGATQTRNPNPVYGQCIDGGTWPNCAGDREMPYLVAPGYTPFGNITLPPTCAATDTVSMTSSCISMGQLWGTSHSAPTVNGMVASLIGRNIFLLNKPELTRAVLMNTSRNVHGNLWDHTRDGKDGAGVIHGADAIAFATGLPSASPQSTAKVKAFNYSTYCQADFGGNSARIFNIAIPNPKPANQHLRVVFTWNSFPDLTNLTNELPDIDINMITNVGQRYSSSWNANVEILDIPAGELTAGASYSVTVFPLTWRRTSGARGTCTYGALTWGFTSTNAR